MPAAKSPHREQQERRNRTARRVNWSEVVQRFITGDLSPPQLSRLYSVTRTQVYRHLEKEGAYEKREEWRRLVAEAATDKAFTDQVALQSELKMYEIQTARRRIELAARFFESIDESRIGGQSAERAAKILEGGLARMREALGAGSTGPLAVSLVLRYVPKSLQAATEEGPGNG